VAHRSDTMPTPPSSPSRTPSSADRAQIDATLETCTTEYAFLQVLPKLQQQYGFDAVDASAAKLLNVSQRKMCWKQVAERNKRMAWMDCELVWVGDRATLSALSIIVTNYALDEVERKSWSFSSNSIIARAAAVDIVQFLESNAARGVPAAGAELPALLTILERDMPDVYSYIDHHEAIDMANGGVRRYAELIGSKVLCSKTQELQELEAKESRRATRQAGASLHTDPLTEDAVSRAEEAIISMGWARANVLAPPKAGIYVTWGLYGYCAFLMLLTTNLAVEWYLKS